MIDGVSIIIPVYNAEHTLKVCLQSVVNLRWDGKREIILVNDGSNDSSAKIANFFSEIRIIESSHQGAAHAINLGLKEAQYDIAVLFDADAVPEKDWLEKIIPGFSDPSIAAIGGSLVTANKSAIGMIAGYDVEMRLKKAPEDINHLSTANTAYRRDSIIKIGLLNEELQAGYDVDLSRKLKAAGYRLLLRHDVRCGHYWKDTLADYLRQQYNYAYFRINITFRSGPAHDDVTGPGMVAQVPFTFFVLLLSIFGSLVFPWAWFTLFILLFIHFPETVTLIYEKRNPRILLLPLIFTLRDLCWAGAAVIWSFSNVVKKRASNGLY
jgi:cellulose synthase/poly-beta-1,6-N-acetylglucosamine synthase-like glycosyltransferase